MKGFKPSELQAFLERKASSEFSFSVVDHLTWDLRSIFEMAVAERVIAANPAKVLYTPDSAKKGPMTEEEVETVLGAVRVPRGSVPPPRDFPP